MHSSRMRKACKFAFNYFMPRRILLITESFSTYNNNNNNNNNIFINCNCVITRWRWLFYMYTKHEIGYY